MYGINNAFAPYGYPQQNPYYTPITPQSGSAVSQQGAMEVVTVQTIQQVEQIGLQPGQHKLVMVQNEPVIASRAADNMGLVTTEYYHLEKFAPGSQMPGQTVDYVTRKEFNDFVASLKPADKEAGKK